MSLPLRSLVVNADDFGLTGDVNRGIIEAHEHGIVTSASLMVRTPAATAAAEYHFRQPSLGLGLHIDLGEWALRGTEWVPLYDVVDLNDAREVEREILSQLKRFKDLVGAYPTHLDSHQHIHRREPILSLIKLIAADLGIPLRGYSRVQSYGDFYGKSWKNQFAPEQISAERLIQILATLPAGPSELTCHPGYISDLTSAYREERVLEVTALCSSAVRAFVAEENIKLLRFDQLP